MLRSRAYRSGMLNRFSYYSSGLFLVMVLTYVGLCTSGARRDITTLDGTTHHRVLVVRENPEGIYVQTEKGAKFLRFRDLPVEIRLEFDYSPRREAAFLKNQEQIRKRKAKATAAAKKKKSKIESRKKRKVYEKTYQRFLRKILGESTSTGTGFFISNDGYLVTNNHVVDDAATVHVVTTDKQVFTAKVVTTVEPYDLALLKVKGRHTALPLSRMRNARQGEDVFTIGFPNPRYQGVTAKLTDGVISSDAGIDDFDKVYQITTPVQPGNSGGPLFNRNGDVVGAVVSRFGDWMIVHTGALPQNVNYAVKSFYIHAMLKLTSGFPREKLAKPFPADMELPDVIQRVKDATVLIVIH